MPGAGSLLFWAAVPGLNCLQGNAGQAGRDRAPGSWAPTTQQTVSPARRPTSWRPSWRRSQTRGAPVTSDDTSTAPGVWGGGLLVAGLAALPDHERALGRKRDDEPTVAQLLDGPPGRTERDAVLVGEITLARQACAGGRLPGGRPSCRPASMRSAK